MQEGETSDEFGPLPAGWSIHVSKSTGKRYYFNKYTNYRSYERPNFESMMAPRAVNASTGAATGGASSGYAQMGVPVYVPTQSHAPHTYTHSLPAAAPTVSNIAPQAVYMPPQSAVPVASEPAGDAVKRPRMAHAEAESATALAVAKGYDREDVGVEGRKLSRILHLKNMNNWVKATLISEFVPKPCARVLDLACGKLGDFKKWKFAGVQRYCGVDISKMSIENARVRFNTLSRFGVAAKLVRADLGITDLTACGVLGPGEQFEAISIQFALHYLFQTEKRALTFFKNIAGRLAPGGVFIGTIPDANYLIRRLRDLPPDEVSWGNEFYTIKFTPESKARQWALGDDPYGCGYEFYLEDSVESLTEYLVPVHLLERLGNAAGLKLLATYNFHEFFDLMHKKPHHAETLSRMGVLDCEGTISEAEWEIMGVYRVFAFQAPPEGAHRDTLPDMRLLVPHPVRVGPPSGVPYKAVLEESDLVDALESAS